MKWEFNRMVSKFRRAAFAILVLTFCFTPRAAFAFTIKEVVNENTVVLDRGDTLHLIGVESNGSTAAAAYVSKVTGSYEVDVELDPDLEAQSHEDTDGNVMAYIYVKAPADPSETDVIRDEKGRIFLNESMLAAGLVKTRIKPSFQRFAEFVHQEAEARRGKKGQWQNSSE